MRPFQLIEHNKHVNITMCGPTCTLYKPFISEKKNCLTDYVQKFDNNSNFELKNKLNIK